MSRKIQELRAHHVDTIVSNYYECGDCFIRKIKDTCPIYNARYLFWRENGKAYICRFDSCRVHQPALIAKDSLSKIIACYKEIIKQKSWNGMMRSDNHGTDSTMSFIAADGSPHTILEYYIGVRCITIDIDEWVFESKITGIDQSTLKFLKMLATISFSVVSKYDKSY